MQMLLTTGDRELPTAMPSLLEELIVHLKNMWFSNKHPAVP
jgi:hypothetical protein